MGRAFTALRDGGSAGKNWRGRGRRRREERGGGDYKRRRECGVGSRKGEWKEKSLVRKLVPDREAAVCLLTVLLPATKWENTTVVRIIAHNTQQ